MIRTYYINHAELFGLGLKPGDKVELFKVPAGSKLIGIDHHREGETGIVFETWSDEDEKATFSIELCE